MDHRLPGSARPIRDLVEEGMRPAQGAALAITGQARSAIESAADGIRSVIEPIGFQPMSVETLARRLARATDELRGVGDETDARTTQEAVDRERLRAALIAGIVLAVFSATVLVVAREIATRRARDGRVGGSPVAPIPVEVADEPGISEQADAPVAGTS